MPGQHRAGRERRRDILFAAIRKNRDYDEGIASLRWMVLHMLEETARHAGHLDAIRELLDGTKGYY